LPSRLSSLPWSRLISLFPGAFFSLRCPSAASLRQLGSFLKLAHVSLPKARWSETIDPCLVVLELLPTMADAGSADPQVLEDRRRHPTIGNVRRCLS